MAVVLSDQEKDATLTQFLSMMEDRVDPDVAKNLLEAVGWDVQAATEQLYGGPQTPARGASMQVDRDMLAGFDAEDVAMEAGPENFLAPPRGGGGIGQDPDGMQSQMDAAMAASFASQTGAGMAQTDDDLLSQALRISQQEEENRQRQQLRSNQEAELAESELMDQMREINEQEQRAQEAVVEQSRLEEERRQAAELEVQAAELEAKRARVPEEPPAGERDRVAIMFRLLDGKKVQRAFRSSEAVGSLYDFLDVHTGLELAQRRYQLVSTMPRQEFVDRGHTLAEAGIKNQFVLMVELSKDD